MVNLTRSDPKAPRFSLDRKKISAVLCVVFGVVGLCLAGWTLYHSLTQQHEVGSLGEAIASSETDLADLNRETSALLASVGKNPSIEESDAYMAKFEDLAGRGVDATTRHRQAIAAITVPESYVDLQATYLQALDHLNRAYTLWSASATAYDLRQYGEAEQRVREADTEWQAYQAAIEDYNLRVVRFGEKTEGT
jgi:hypothetical protein